jgi:cellobiose epimerase
VITTAKRMTDHTIENAWDEENGGFYDRGYYFEGDRELTVTDSSKVWWAQSEALNTLLIMANYYPDDPNNYFDKFTSQWEYIDNYLIDHEHGGWYDSGLDEDPESATSRKSQIWKGNYHTVRTLLGCLERLEE